MELFLIFLTDPGQAIFAMIIESSLKQSKTSFGDTFGYPFSDIVASQHKTLVLIYFFMSGVSTIFKL